MCGALVDSYHRLATSRRMPHGTELGVLHAIAIMGRELHQQQQQRMLHQHRGQPHHQLLHQLHHQLHRQQVLIPVCTMPIRAKFGERLEMLVRMLFA